MSGWLGYLLEWQGSNKPAWQPVPSACLPWASPAAPPAYQPCWCWEVATERREPEKEMSWKGKSSLFVSNTMSKLSQTSTLPLPAWSKSFLLSWCVHRQDTNEEVRNRVEVRNKVAGELELPDNISSLISSETAGTLNILSTDKQEWCFLSNGTKSPQISSYLFVYSLEFICGKP